MLNSLRLRLLSLLAAALLLAAVRAGAQNPDVFGEYAGSYHADPVTTWPATAKVIAEGPGYYRLVIQAAPEKAAPADGFQIEVFGVEQGAQVNLFGRAGGRDWSGSLQGGHLQLSGNYYDISFDLKRTVRKSSTEGLEPPAGAVVLLPFKPGTPPSLDAWNNPTWKPLPDGSMQVGAGSIATRQSFGDVKLHMEFRLPLQAGRFGQERGNSGLFFEDLYEIQVLDSFGLVPSMGDCGAIYSQVRPRVSASLPPLTWQTYDITFHAPRLDAQGKVTRLPRVTVALNGITIHDNDEIATPTADPKAAVKASGPIVLQDHGNPIQFRNIWAVELKDEADKQ